MRFKTVSTALILFIVVLLVACSPASGSGTPGSTDIASGSQAASQPVREIVGTWSTQSVQIASDGSTLVAVDPNDEASQMLFTIQLIVNEDGTLLFTSDSAGTGEDSTGTWTEDGAAYIFHFEQDGSTFDSPATLQNGTLTIDLDGMALTLTKSS